MPLGTVNSTHAKSPLPSTSSAKPVTAERRHSRAVGSGVPRARLHAQSSPPAMANRIATIANGGKVRTATRMAGAVEPHNT